MAYVYKNITSSGSAETLIARSSGVTNTGNISKVNISNNSTNAATVSIYLGVDTSNTADFYIIKSVVIPPGVALLLDDSVNFNSKLYNLIIHNTGTSPSLTIIIE